ncbi:2-succinyl-5-enolpyruvyl-6-hydroxy-3-cyclohexene-1-carboxylic-acid synthase [Vibrio vulnificus]|uniref:2-succinyl-5-enolpyruvyl-6-hydroxy-3- cyclohexene-1-carboxylic-acid synthase n=1 Tax=Vibrio vulnificus TaxID=672 RepID=UPI001593195F|nr:2-succinyl-5-enolpyruvyl-6-hydroxy-3-cyclohexene-1-carboxylic-acid synthase [Vibrio vulnificus]EID4387783.1 2-succinyl-5-enolpyruvyl-6-hydroxy-3-cyclohexene-1-carboxylic-acid synthase [Vibrio vulnificus]EIU7745569.1 2-succinyl-5-enolpyruvyl-6-hydroxy-3-cyclohexene-1-carboxylic-acid synthase [Vibrio vulnificus]EJN6715382.1 2-succinyl-5-enolpyruvyl-6-hydroxy-3-cyclohexene-1-carboxylic-acid synthase [Vibrio vulnificus]EJQ9991329.1 2-succinyl-5-enolpyruvyl-6-hydroxy-3-cyclohexene-1-carboxylic-ac
MNHDQAVLNRIWCETLFEELYRFGVRDVCVAPGSRSTPLALEANAHTRLKLHTHFDERGLGFLALGLAKASQRPVAVVVTSGTAVANLLPAVAEAGLTGEKLVLLTADRPIELVGCGANQAIAQQGIFSNHVCASLNLPSPNTQTSLNWLLTSVDQVLHQQAVSGHAVHINCPFPEPLYSNAPKSIYQSYIDTVAVWRAEGGIYSNKQMPLPMPPSIAEIEQRKGVVVIGSVTLQEAKQAHQFAAQMGWPVLCDPQSGTTSDWSGFDIWLQNPAARAQLSQCDLIIQFGRRLVSKRLHQWLEQQVQAGCDYWYVSPDFERDNQSHLPQQHFVCSIAAWLNVVTNREVQPVAWANELPRFSAEVNKQAREIAQSSLCEMMIALHLSSLVGSADLFLGNSLFVRMVDMVGQLHGVETFTNRGASGIDGLFATASGVQRARSNPMLLMIGDTSALYDLNSLALYSHQETPVVIVVTNNDGGAIFDLLPVPPQQKQALYQMPHGYRFEFAAKQFGLDYVRPTSMTELTERIVGHFAHGCGALLVEVNTPPNQASQHIKQLADHVRALV